MQRVVSALKAMKDFEAVSVMQAEIMNTEQEVRRKNNVMIEDVLSAGLKNENRLLQIEINESKEKDKNNRIRIAGLIIIIVLLVVSGLYYRNSLQQKLKLAGMREKISQNLHDDIGASISSLHIYSSIAQDALLKNPVKAGTLLERITEQSLILMENMNDMVWSMKSDRDVMPLGTRLKNFGSELLTVQDIKCRYEIDEDAFRLFKGFEERKNILLVIKEAMNNISKYSQAKEAAVVFKKCKEGFVELIVEDNGKGFEEALIKRGNGLNNMSNRIKEMKGTFQVKSANGKGTRIRSVIPIP
ncbi:MAG: histidine kinase [Chitinophagaceae bacterium]|nr:histidine kinase [Chitinophagaceae bacterium]